MYAVKDECLVRGARRRIGSEDIGADCQVPCCCCLLRRIIQTKESHGLSIAVGGFNLVTVGVLSDVVASANVNGRRRLTFACDVGLKPTCW